MRRAVVDHTVLLVDLNNKNTDMEQNIDIELLISLVEMKPVLWGKSLEEYKCRSSVTSAWKEVCCGLREDFESLDDKEMNEFGMCIYFSIYKHS